MAEKRDDTAQLPRLTLLERAMIDRVVDEAYEILAQIGVMVESEEALALLGDGGARVDGPARRAFIPRDPIERALASAPASFDLHDAPGQRSATVGGDGVLFNPGSAALNVLDYGGELRRARSSDYLRLCRLVEQLPHLELSSTALVCADAPTELADAYRLYLALHACRKPIVTGLFRKEGFGVMRDLLAAARGGEQQLRERPLAIFDACSSPPLRWSELTANRVICCARAGIPSNIIAMPLAGATGPVSLLGSITQHTAENLVGVLLAQLARSGAPVIFGGAPAAFDMRHGTTPMAAAESLMLDLGYCEVGHALGLPVHSYLALSDAKRIDMQAGYETGMGVLLAVLGRVNLVSGPGILDYITCQSLEKLVIDHELCATAKRFLEGIRPLSPTLARDALAEAVAGDGHFLSHPTTLRLFRRELRLPGAVVDRTPTVPPGHDGPAAAGELERAHAVVEELLARQPYAPPPEVARDLDGIIASAARACGATLPRLALGETGKES